jgi:rhamnose transport system permease protein
MKRTVFGRLSYAIGNNELATKYSGHNTFRLKIRLFSISGAISAFAAFQYIGQYQSAKSDNAATMLLFV